MSYIGNIDKARKQLADVYTNDRKRIEKVRDIMERELGRPVDYKEAQRFATNLICFYKALAQGRKIVHIIEEVDDGQ